MHSSAVPSTHSGGTRPWLLFDNAKRRVCEVKTPITNTPLQALTLMNDLTYLEASPGSRPKCYHLVALIEEQIKFIFQHLLSRNPNAEELNIVQIQLKELETFYRSHPDQAKRYLRHGQPETIPKFASGSFLDKQQEAPQLAALSSITSIP